SRVIFAYDDAAVPAVDDISFTVAPGKIIALVGPSGSGKSTLINLINRFYDPQYGHVLMDGHDLRDLRLNWIRQNIALVLQDGFLFWGTVRENIRYGKIDATDQEVEEAARLTNADEFIRCLPDSYETALGERGVTLSGGQRQRIAIARAILKNAPILILDEATSSLDMESEQKIQAALRVLTVHRTTFIIAHRLSTVEHADEIFVLSKGRLLQRGNHETLVRQDGLYSRIHALHRHGTGSGHDIMV
ncbi:MAG TPA: hypothetical protein DC049_04065, partial [Spirochaetia bacterium]|nr:hypothetical protein [Spirochaetia bacterium]